MIPRPPNAPKARKTKSSLNVDKIMAYISTLCIGIVLGLSFAKDAYDSIEIILLIALGYTYCKVIG